MLVPADINQTRQKFFDLKCKLIQPEYMLSPTYKEDFEKVSRDLPNETIKMVTIDVNIRYCFFTLTSEIGCPELSSNWWKTRNSQSLSRL
jgi:hypothetical protein